MVVGAAEHRMRASMINGVHKVRAEAAHRAVSNWMASTHGVPTAYMTQVLVAMLEGKVAAPDDEPDDFQVTAAFDLKNAFNQGGTRAQQFRETARMGNGDELAFLRADHAVETEMYVLAVIKGQLKHAVVMNNEGSKQGHSLGPELFARAVRRRVEARGWVFTHPLEAMRAN